MFRVLRAPLKPSCMSLSRSHVPPPTRGPAPPKGQAPSHPFLLKPGRLRAPCFRWEGRPSEAVKVSNSPLSRFLSAALLRAAAQAPAATSVPLGLECFQPPSGSPASLVAWWQAMQGIVGKSGLAQVWGLCCLCVKLGGLWHKLQGRCLSPPGFRVSPSSLLCY